MTEERQNEIWAMLTQSEKEDIKEIYNTQSEEFWDRGYDAALKFIFGKHNLTAQVEEKPKEPKFHVGDKVRIIAGPCVNPDYVGIVDEIAEVNGRYKLKNTDSNWEDDCFELIEPYTEPKEEVETSDEKDTCLEDSVQSGFHILPHGAVIVRHDIDYHQYRLDLAKEIAVAIITSHNEPMLRSTAEVVVDFANEIVERLKETEI